MPQNNDISRTINEKGCVQAGEEWVERNLIIISSTAIFLAFMQVSIQIGKYLFDLNHFSYNFVCFVDFRHLLCTEFASGYFCTKIQMEMKHHSDTRKRLNSTHSYSSCRFNRYYSTGFQHITASE